MARGLTHKEKGFVLDIANGETGVQAAFNNYDTESYSTAGNIASENLDKPKIIEALKGLGFDSNNAKTVVAEILSDETNEPKDRLKAAEMIFKVHGDYAPEKSINVNVEVEASSEVKDLTEKLNGIYRGTSVGSDGGTPRALGTQAQD